MPELPEDNIDEFIALTRFVSRFPGFDICLTGRGAHPRSKGGYSVNLEYSFDFLVPTNEDMERLVSYLDGRKPQPSERQPVASGEQLGISDFLGEGGGSEEDDGTFAVGAGELTGDGEGGGVHRQ